MCINFLVFLFVLWFGNSILRTMVEFSNWFCNFFSSENSFNIKVKRKIKHKIIPHTCWVIVYMLSVQKREIICGICYESFQKGKGIYGRPWMEKKGSSVFKKYKGLSKWKNRIFVLVRMWWGYKCHPKSKLIYENKDHSNQLTILKIF